MIRIICRVNDCTLMAAGANECPSVTHKTFDVELPELERWLTTAPTQHVYRDFIGIEIFPAATLPRKGTEMAEPAAPPQIPARRQTRTR